VADHATDPTNADELHLPPLRRRARVRRIIAFAIVLVVAALAAAFLLRPKPVVELFRTAPLARRTIVRVVDATGHIRVKGRVEVPAPMPGRLVQILVASGTRVAKGQTLARLDDRAQRLALSQAQASERAAAGRLAEARVAADAAAQEQQHVERLVQRGLASQQEAVDAKTAAERTSAALSAAQAEENAASEAVASAALARNATEIAAPVAGVVLTAPETAGAMVDPSQGALFVIGDSLQALRVDAMINEADVTEVRVGQPAPFNVQGLPGRTFEGRVEEIALEPRVENGVVSYPVTLTADNTDGLLRPGMTAIVHLEVARAEHVLAVHEAALRFTPSGAPPAPPRTRVWRRVGPAEAEAVDITAGLSDGAYTQVTPAAGEQLQEGDPIIIGLFNPDDSGSNRPSITLGKKP
jgi:HlyD family secretion protein